MVALRIPAFLLIAGVLPIQAGSSRPAPAAPEQGSRRADTLFIQSAGAILEREFHRADLSYLLLDARTGAVLVSRWEGPAKPIPLGSLVKPFTALAYGEAHQNRFPLLRCRGAAGFCSPAHGKAPLDLARALSLSCNSYFGRLAEELTGADLVPVARRFQFDPPDPALTGPALAGLGERWPISPIQMARAYLELSRRQDEPVARELLSGMALSARVGTGKGVGRALGPGKALVKTGTAPCSHSHPAPGDGFALALLPANRPELLLLVRLHSAPGREAARIAGEMLRRLPE